LPVLFLGPYDVSPGFVRDEWLAAFETVSYFVCICCIYEYCEMFC
jgi:hypothetical protein